MRSENDQMKGASSPPASCSFLLFLPASDRLHSTKDYPVAVRCAHEQEQRSDSQAFVRCRKAGEPTPAAPPVSAGCGRDNPLVVRPDDSPNIQHRDYAVGTTDANRNSLVAAQLSRRQLASDEEFHQTPGTDRHQHEHHNREHSSILGHAANFLMIRNSTMNKQSDRLATKQYPPKVDSAAANVFALFICFECINMRPASTVTTALTEVPECPREKI